MCDCVYICCFLQWMEDIVHGAGLVLVQKHVAADAFNAACELVQILCQWTAGSLVLDSLSKQEHAVYGAAQVLKRLKCISKQILRGLDPTLGGLNGVLWLRFCGLLTGSLALLFSLKPHYHYHYRVVLVTEYVIHYVQISTKDYDLLPYLTDWFNCLFYTVDGGYSLWSPWLPCDADCGGGIQERNRFCNNPAPQIGGNDCTILGSDKQTRLCNLFPCNVNFQWHCRRNLPFQVKQGVTNSLVKSITLRLHHPSLATEHVQKLINIHWRSSKRRISCIVIITVVQQ